MKIRTWSFCIKDFYVSAITPIEMKENSFELEFDPIDSSDDRFVIVTWKNNTLSEIELKS
jgi:hypothetical protein